ncbi:MAG: putative LPS assembly protein LptD, partial [Candidatus Kapaibacterium sp.]
MRTITFPSISFLFLLLLAFVAMSGTGYAQRRTPRRNDATSRRVIPPTDSTRASAPASPIDSARQATVPPRDSLRADSLAPDSLAVRTGTSGVDTVIVYTARDSMVFDVKSRVLRLYGDAVVTKGAQKLTAAYIEIDFTKSELYAEARYDSATHKYYGVPVFKDAQQELSANTLRYNFNTKQGTLGAAETKLADGFYYGDKIKRVNENTLFVRNGVYTTCDAPHPHYYFSSPEMKVITGDRVFADQLKLSVADVPIFYLPIGVFFPSNSGRHSGLILPRPSQTSTFGFTLEGLGYFWAASDYFDTQISADLYSKGGATFHDNSRIVVRDLFMSSSVNLTYGLRRSDVDASFVRSYIINIQHQQKLSRTASLSGDINFTSTNALRNTTTRLNQFGSDYTTQVASSNISFQKSWSWGGGFSSSYQRYQNIINGSLTQTIPFNFTFPTITLAQVLGSPAGEENLLNNLNPTFG